MVSGGLAIKQGYTGKRCPKCGGNIFIDRDLRSWYEECLQCGYTSDLPAVDMAGVKGYQAAAERSSLCNFQN